MTHHDRTIWSLAAGLAAMAGYVDAIGFLTLGGLSVSFMSGNTTRLAVGIVTDPTVAMTASRFGTASMGAASGAALLLAVCAMVLGPAKPWRPENGDATSSEA